MHPNYYWSPIPNVVYVGEGARACTYEISETIYRSHTYAKLYSRVPQDMPMNPEQLQLLIHLISERGASIQMQEHVHAVLLLWEFYRISFFTHESRRDRTMHCVQEIDIVATKSCLPKTDRNWAPVLLPSLASTMLGCTDNNT